jgi:hypothetical protein
MLLLLMATRPYVSGSSRVLNACHKEVSLGMMRIVSARAEVSTAA